MITRICPFRHSGFISCVASSSRTLVRPNTTAPSLSEKAAAFIHPSATPKVGHGRTKVKASAGHTFGTVSEAPTVTNDAQPDSAAAPMAGVKSQASSANVPHPSTPGGLTGSHRLFATRKQQRALVPVWKPPNAKPILECLPPLPPIHDYDLALAATDFSTTPGSEMSFKLALLGDAILAERCIFALDKAGMAKTAGELTVSFQALHR